MYGQIKSKTEFPIFVARKNPQHTITLFRQQKNAILFAAGSIWQGMDFPHDMVSSLIIPKLPFPQPDAVSEAIRSQCDTMEDFLDYSVVPIMQKKLRQGAGRAIRTETDTCVVSILDCRASKGRRYHEAARKALPEMPITEKLEDVEEFIHRVKEKDYFQNING